MQNKNRIRKDCKSKNNELMDNAKDTIGLGIGSMAGLGAMGAMQNLPGMPKEAAGITSIAGSGLMLANVGQMAKTGMSLTNTLTGATSSKPKKQATKTKSNDIVSKILYG